MTPIETLDLLERQAQRELSPSRESEIGLSLIRDARTLHAIAAHCRAHGGPELTVVLGMIERQQ